MTEVLALAQPIKARDPDSGKHIDIVGIDVSSCFGPKLIAVDRGPKGIWARLIEYADELPQ